MLVQQDVVRRDILRVKDMPRNPAIKLMEEIIVWRERWIRHNPRGDLAQRYVR